jgi:tetratricopeptide (TPR) repeat protein
MIPTRATAISLLLLSAAALAGRPPNPFGNEKGGPRWVRPRVVERLPLQSDFDRCVLRISDSGNESIQGRLRLQLLVRESGEVYAAYVHSEKGVEDRRLERCLTSVALLWRLPAVALDYSRPYVLNFVPGGTQFDFSDPVYWSGGHYAVQGRASVFMPDIDDPPAPAELDAKVAQATLEVSEQATDAEYGIAQLEVRRYGEAIVALRRALEKDRDDPLALRGLAIALAESGSNLREARFLGERLVDEQPDSEASHEALLRVCIAAGDDHCTYAEWKAARGAKDFAPRSRHLAELQPLVEKGAARLRAWARSEDACAAEKTDRDRALCVVRRCLDTGTSAFADELSGEKQSSFEVRDWRAEAAREGRLVVTRPLGDGKEEREPRWLVKIGEQTVTMTPTNEDARHITLRHSACKVVPAGTGAAREIAKGAAIKEPIVKAP